MRRFFNGRAPLLGVALFISANALSANTTSDDLAWLATNRSRLMSLFDLRVEDPQIDDRSEVPGSFARDTGELLFFDRRLSGSGTLSCATCHQPKRLWTDGRRTAIGTKPLAVNTPTLLGVRRLKWLFWDGRMLGLAHQAVQPMNNPDELATNPAHLVQLIHSDDTYRAAYQHYFGELPNIACQTNLQPSCVSEYVDVTANIGKFLGQFVASIPSPTTPFDEFMAGLRQGKLTTQSPQALRGLRLFVEKGNCAACHSGRDLTDGQFHNVLVPEMAGPGVFSAGRYAGIISARAGFDKYYGNDFKFRLFVQQELSRVRGDSSTYGAFKTPTLRGLRCTGPFMHNGRYTSLEDVVDHYSRFEDVLRPDHHDDPLVVPRNFTNEEREDIVTFLLTLSANHPNCPPMDQ